MKKIAYLVAPLMVMPFLIGCNKVKTHKVQSVLSVGGTLKFTTMKGKELKNSAFNHKQNFKFKVETDDQAGLTIDPNGIGIYVGKDAVMPLLDGYSVEFTNKEKTAATVTVFANKVTDDIYIDSIAAKEGNYIYCVPLMLGVQMPIGRDTLGWAPIGSSLDLEFEGVGEESNPDEDCFLYTDDAEHFYYKDTTEESWYKKHISFGAGTEGRVKVTVNANSMQGGTGYLLIAARSGGKDSFLDAFKWDEIKELTRNGFAPYLFRIGEKKTVNLKIGTVDVQHTVHIIGFNHDKENSITFQFENVISDAIGAAVKRQWHDQTDSSDFEHSTLNDSLKNEVMPRLPDDLQNNIETVTKFVGKYNKKSGKWELGNYSAQLFPLALAEVLGDKEDISTTYAYAVKGEGTRYEYFKDITTEYGSRQLTDVRNKYYVAYWLRSPNNYNNNGVANYVNASGEIGYQGTYVTNTIGVAPAFVI